MQEEAETGGGGVCVVPGACWLASLAKSVAPGLVRVSQQVKWRVPEEDTYVNSRLHIHMHMLTHINIYISQSLKLN